MQRKRIQFCIKKHSQTMPEPPNEDRLHGETHWLFVPSVPIRSTVYGFTHELSPGAEHCYIVYVSRKPWLHVVGNMLICKHYGCIPLSLWRLPEESVVGRTASYEAEAIHGEQPCPMRLHFNRFNWHGDVWITISKSTLFSANLNK